MQRTYYRSEEALEWRKLYSLAAWRKGKASYLAQHPVCRFHEDRGEVAQATDVDHITPHKGDLTLFLDRSNWQGLCKPCHDRWKKQIETKGYHDHCDADGYPTDPNHPFNKRRRS